MGLEAEIERSLAKTAKGLGIASYKFSSPSRAGVPDRIFIFRGTVLFLEVKAPSKTPTDLQIDEMLTLRQHQANVTWVDNRVDGSKLLQVLSQIGTLIELEEFESFVKNAFSITRHLSP